MDTTRDIIQDLRQGKMVILMDDVDRENEGDLVIAAEVVEPAHVNFFARHACGLICLAITEERARRLNIQPMVQSSPSPHETNFAVSIEAAQGVTTGISAADRARTIRAAVAPQAGAKDIVMPGHIFPLIAKSGGVLIRAGHTEAGCDLARLAGYEPAAMIVEIMNEDGTMARRPQLLAFAREHKLRIGSIADLIHYRVLNECTVERFQKKQLQTRYGPYTLYAYRDTITEANHLALVAGQVQPGVPCLVRVHYLNVLRDLLETQHPAYPGSWSLHQALQRIAQEGNGVLVLLDQGGNRKRFREELEAFPQVQSAAAGSGQLGSPQVYRQVGTGSQILRDLGVHKIRLLGSPTRYNAISGFGLEVVEFLEYAECADTV